MFILIGVRPAAAAASEPTPVVEEDEDAAAPDDESAELVDVADDASDDADDADKTDDADDAEEALVPVFADVLDQVADAGERGAVLEVGPPVLVLDDERPWHEGIWRPAALLRPERLSLLGHHHRTLGAIDMTRARAR